MKKLKKTTKLTLHRDTVRALSSSEASQIAGGIPSLAMCNSYLGTCRTLDCPLN